MFAFLAEHRQGLFPDDAFEDLFPSGKGRPSIPASGWCYKWATFSHATKPKKWIVARYFGKHNKFRNDHWVFATQPATLTW